jgi:hypothetical protein
MSLTLHLRERDFFASFFHSGLLSTTEALAKEVRLSVHFFFASWISSRSPDYVGMSLTLHLLARDFFAFFFLRGLLSTTEALAKEVRLSVHFFFASFSS